jgi:hypothetical protein
VGFIPARTVEDALSEALKIHGPNATIACVRNPQGA